jgi:UDP-N-acetylglucosamine 4,6-dehydratase
MFTERSDYTVNGLGERGKLVPERFEYNSQTNDHFLEVRELRALNEAVDGAEVRHRNGAVRA